MNIKTTYKLFILILATILGACSKMDSFHEEWADNKEVIYAPKPDSIFYSAGNQRAEIGFIFNTAHRVDKCGIFWNEGTDSAFITVSSANDTTIVKTILDSMEEKSYAFQIYTYDFAGNKSVKTEKFGSVYGEKYRKSLKNRIPEIVAYEDGSAKLKWISVIAESINSEIEYINSLDDTISLVIPRDSTVTLLDDYKLGSDLKVKTSHIPEINCIDTFLTDYNTYSQDTAISKFDNLPYVEYVGLDSITKGSWIGTYGSEGYSVIGKDENISNELSVSWDTDRSAVWTWAASSAELRAVQYPDGSGRIAACRYSSTNPKSEWTITLDLGEEEVYQVALYFLDFNSESTENTIEILDSKDMSVKATQNIANFEQGKYMIWNLGGEVTINLKQVNGNVLLSGLFID